MAMTVFIYFTILTKHFPLNLNKNHFAALVPYTYIVLLLSVIHKRDENNGILKYYTIHKR